jgi:hypothetical protein
VFIVYGIDSLLSLSCIIQIVAQLLPSGDVIVPKVIFAWSMVFCSIAASLPPGRGTVILDSLFREFDTFGHFLFIHLKEMMEYKHLLGWSTPLIAMRRLPQLLTLSWMSICQLLMHLFFIRSICNKLVLLTYRMAKRWCCSWEIGQKNLALWPFFLCALSMQKC